jgi:nucleotide-binding universal stress UspA family protein
MRWILGIDEHDRSRGATEVAAWLHEHGPTPDQHEGFAVHVVEGHRVAQLPERARGDLLAATKVRIEDALVAHGARPAIAEVFVDVDALPESALERYADVMAGDVLLVGRIGTREVQSVTRLGRVARRLLRTLPRAVAVVPPDLQRTAIGAGAVVLATDLGSASVGAGAIARRLAASIGRELVVVHVDSTPGPELADVVGWTRHQSLEPARVRLAHGDVLDRVLEIADDEHAPFIVCGSRLLSASERIFTSSIGTDLARVAERPVLVVPPGPTRAASR